jgi:hypothetical protein
MSLLLHSLVEFREIIMRCMQITKSVSAVEIGTGEGQFTNQLIQWATSGQFNLYCIDPRPADRVRSLCEESEYAQLFEASSLMILPSLQPCDAYFLDSDHNYYTVTKELEWIAQVCESVTKEYVVFIHDIGGLCARRDCYFSPESLPPEAVHPYHLSSDLSWISENEFGTKSKEHLTGKLAIANQDGGPRNGVLTAVEDFLRERPFLIFKRIPCVFGLGIIYSEKASFAKKLTHYLNPFHDNPLLRRLEENRLELYIKYVEKCKKMT